MLLQQARMRAHQFIDQLHQNPTEREIVYAWLAAHFGDKDGMYNGREGSIHIRYLGIEECQLIVALIQALLDRNHHHIPAAKQEIQTWGKTRQLLRPRRLSDFMEESEVLSSLFPSSVMLGQESVKKEIKSFPAQLHEELMVLKGKCALKEPQFSHNEMYLLVIIDEIVFENLGSEQKIAKILENKTLLAELMSCMMTYEEQNPLTETSAEIPPVAPEESSIVLDVEAIPTKVNLEALQKQQRELDKTAQKSVAQWNKEITQRSKEEPKETVSALFCSTLPSSPQETLTPQYTRRRARQSPTSQTDPKEALWQEKVALACLRANKRKKKMQEKQIELCESWKRRIFGTLISGVLMQESISAMEEGIKIGSILQEMMNEVVTKGDEMKINPTLMKKVYVGPAFPWNVHIKGSDNILTRYFVFILLDTPTILNELQQALTSIGANSLLCKEKPGVLPHVEEEPRVFTQGDLSFQSQIELMILKSVIEEVNFPQSMLLDAQRPAQMIFLMRNEKNRCYFPRLIDSMLPRNGDPYFSRKGIGKSFYSRDYQNFYHEKKPIDNPVPTEVSLAQPLFLKIDPSAQLDFQKIAELVMIQSNAVLREAGSSRDVQKVGEVEVDVLEPSDSHHAPKKKSKKKNRK